MCTFINFAILGVVLAVGEVQIIIARLAMEATGIGKSTLGKGEMSVIHIVLEQDITSTNQPMLVNTAKVAEHNVEIVLTIAVGVKTIQIKILATPAHQAIISSMIGIINARTLFHLILEAQDFLFHKLNIVIHHVLCIISLYFKQIQVVIHPGQTLLL
jgi:hypothetical protein